MITFTKYQKKLLEMIPNITLRDAIRKILRTFDEHFSLGTHVHGNITNAGAVGTTQHKILVTGASGAVTTLNTGTTDNQVLMTTGVAGQVEVQTMGTGSDVPAVGNHAHGQLGNTGLVAANTTADKVVMTTTGGALKVESLGTTSTVPAAGNHVHGGISNDGKVGIAANLPLHTGSDGVVEVGAFGTSANQFAEGNHAHGNLTNGGLVGTETGKVVMTTTDGALAAATMGTGAGVPAEGNHTHAYSADTHVHGGISNDGKIGSAATLPIITGAGGVLQVGQFGSAGGTFAEGNHAHFRGHEFTPVIPVDATLTVAGAENGDVVYTAKVPGVSGHDITVAHFTPGVADADTQVLKPFGVSVPQDSDIVVQLAGTADGVYSEGTFTITGGGGDNIEDGETITIDTTVYRCKSTMAQEYDFQYHATAATCLANLVDAINGDNVGTSCYTGTVAHPLFEAESTDLVMTITALVAGTAANGKDTTDTVADADWGGAVSAGGLAADLTITTTGAAVVTGVTNCAEAIALVDVEDEEAGDGLAGVAAEAPLAGGVDGTEGDLGDWGFDATHIYVSKGASTIIASHWYSTAQVMAALE